MSRVYFNDCLVCGGFCEPDSPLCCQCAGSWGSKGGSGLNRYLVEGVIALASNPGAIGLRSYGVRLRRLVPGADGAPVYWVSKQSGGRKQTQRWGERLLTDRRLAAVLYRWGALGLDGTVDAKKAAEGAKQETKLWGSVPRGELAEPLD